MSENMGQFVSAAAAGDTDAMAKLYSKTLKASYFLAEVLSCDATQAAEITKKAYAKAFCTVGKLKKPEAFEIWMKQIVASVYKETQQFVFNDAQAGSGEDSTEFLSEEIYEDTVKSETALEAVSKLGPELRTAVVLHYNNGMPVAIIAKFLGVSESTANALLGKARASLAAELGVESASGLSDSLPVLSRIFKRAAAQSVIDSALVRDIFLFAIDAYNAVTQSSVSAKSVKDEEPEVGESAEEEVPVEDNETVQNESETDDDAESETETQADEEADDPEKTADDSDDVPQENEKVILFKEKINEILNSEEIPSAAPSITDDDGDEDDGLAVPEFSSPVQIAEQESVSDEILDSFDEEPESKTVASEKKKNGGFSLATVLKKLTPKTAAIALAAVVVVVLAIFGISKISGREKTPDGQSDFKWVAGGFEECEEIRYLNEDCCVFKSKTTGKYGLLDYQGNIILQPNYDEFKTCGSGRDHSGRGSYHILVKIGNENFEVTVTGTSVTISTTSHAAHSIVTDELSDKLAYDERDRYFEGYAAARKDGKWGYVSQEKDKKVIPYEYEAVNDFDDITMLSTDYCRKVSNGLIPVKKDGKMGIINLDNDVVVDFEYTNILEGSDGVFIAEKNGIWGVILTGNAVNSFAGVNVSVAVTPPAPTTPSGEKTEKYVVDSEDGANVRSDAGADYDKLGELAEGAEVYVISTKKAENGNKWACIEYDGGYGWIAMANLKAVSE